MTAPGDDAELTGSVDPLPVPEPLPAATAGPAPADDWPARATGTIVGLVATVREATTGRVLTLASAAVYGLVIATAGALVGVLGTIVLFRATERAYAAIAEMPWVRETFGLEAPVEPMWAVYVTWGLVLIAVGRWRWRKRPRLAPPTG